MSVTVEKLHEHLDGMARVPSEDWMSGLDERKRKPRSVDDDFIADVKTKVRDAAEALRTGTLPTVPTRPASGRSCSC